MKVKTFNVGENLVTNCYIVSEGADCAVIDPGFEPERIISELERDGLSPSAVLLTHGHRDHIGGVRKLARRFGARVYIGRDDAYRLNFPEAVLLDGGETIAAGALCFTVTATPGHTEGGVCYISGDCLFSGDTLFHDSIGRTDMPGGDFETLLRSLKTLRELPGDYTVFPGHEEPSTLSHERECNRYMNAVE